MRFAHAFAPTVVALTLAGLGALTGCAADPVAGSPTANARDISTTAGPPGPEFGPLGFGALRLGMSIADARATGEIARLDEQGQAAGCANYTTHSGWSGFVKDGEIVAIMPGKLTAKTPEGITAGSTLDEVRTAYPDLKLGGNWSSATVPGHEGHYGFLGIRVTSGPEARVTQMLLYSDADTCHN